jgi:deoxyribose-phosphate aldolase
MTKNKYATYFDHTILKPDARKQDIEKLCAEALQNHFFSVCVNPFWVPTCSELLKGSDVAVCTVIGFPLGANSQKIKIHETELAVQQGATEVDVVLNIGALKDKNISLVTQELTAVVSAAGSALTKVIVESGLLSPEELRWAIDAVNASGAAFIKTSTGFATVGATPEAVSTMAKYGRPGLKIKASGGIRSAQDFLQYVNLGAHRVGASKSVEILQQLAESI